MNNFQEEKMKILKMIENGKISSEEGLNLLNALVDDNKLPLNIKNKPAKWLKIKIYDNDEDKTKVNVKLPIRLIDIGLKIGTKFSPELKESGLTKQDINEIMEAVKNGESGKIIDVESENGEKVEITLE